MNRNDVIADLNYSFDTELLLMYFDQIKHSGIPYEDYRGVIDNWNIIRVEPFEYCQKIFNDLGIVGEPRFYELKEYTVLPYHKDHGTQCSINVLLSGNAAPISFDGHEYYYRNCLLNTQESHAVYNGPSPRVLFKISIKDQSFQKTKNILKNNGLLSNSN